ncbi:uncharacterized protein LOC120255396 isoform X2 [Dioscorea cayenensis subsp. rotundata]|uniref:Uncharacterized protein LOC120255396 isoform X2 n=1 Tax=Dioscorea cayennensis subsp. rotundata TaxID=55577 RepID=A0AB40AW15_DIOCR|nr:uncharacterized protein LOC120255396 isoform X2 [Dioscorea cayenensis subsp. rotundata]
MITLLPRHTSASAPPPSTRLGLRRPLPPSTSPSASPPLMPLPPTSSRSSSLLSPNPFPSTLRGETSELVLQVYTLDLRTVEARIVVVGISTICSQKENHNQLEHGQEVEELSNVSDYVCHYLHAHFWNSLWLDFVNSLFVFILAIVAL